MLKFHFQNWCYFLLKCVILAYCLPWGRIHTYIYQKLVTINKLCIIFSFIIQVHWFAKRYCFRIFSELERKITNIKSSLVAESCLWMKQFLTCSMWWKNNARGNSLSGKTKFHYSLVSHCSSNYPTKQRIWRTNTNDSCFTFSFMNMK